MCKINKLLGMFIVISFNLVACGGGGGGGSGSTLSYTGTTSPAAVDASNAEVIGTTATEAATQVVVGGATPFGVSISGNSSTTFRKQVNNIVNRIITDLQQYNALPIGVTYTADYLNSQISQEMGETVNWFCGGSLDGPSDLFSTGNGSLTFNSLCFDPDETGDPTYQIILNGKVKVSHTESGDSWTDTTSYTNFSVTVNGETYTVSGTQICSGNDVTFEYTCADLYTGEDGSVYKVEDSFSYGDPVGGFYIDATFYHPDYGSVTINTTTAVTFNCTNGKPDGGVISFTGEGGSSGSITFNSDCASYTITYNDGAGDTGTIPGMW